MPCWFCTSQLTRAHLGRSVNMVSTKAILTMRHAIKNLHLNTKIIVASYIICADGGANRLYDMMKKHGKESTEVRKALVELQAIHALTGICHWYHDSALVNAWICDGNRAYHP